MTRMPRMLRILGGPTLAAFFAIALGSNAFADNTNVSSTANATGGNVVAINTQTASQSGKDNSLKQVGVVDVSHSGNAAASSSAQAQGPGGRTNVSSTATATGGNVAAVNAQRAGQSGRGNDLAQVGVVSVTDSSNAYAASSASADGGHGRENVKSKAAAYAGSVVALNAQEAAQRGKDNSLLQVGVVDVAGVSNAAAESSASGGSSWRRGSRDDVSSHATARAGSVFAVNEQAAYQAGRDNDLAQVGVVSVKDAGNAAATSSAGALSLPVHHAFDFGWGSYGTGDREHGSGLDIAFDLLGRIGFNRVNCKASANATGGNTAATTDQSAGQSGHDNGLGQGADTQANGNGNALATASACNTTNNITNTFIISNGSNGSPSSMPTPVQHVVHMVASLGGMSVGTDDTSGKGSGAIVANTGASGGVISGVNAGSPGNNFPLPVIGLAGLLALAAAGGIFAIRRRQQTAV